MKIVRSQAFHLQAPLEKPYKTTFGVMTHRQAVIIRLTDSAGCEGIGETYINFPKWAPAGRLELYRAALFPEITGIDVDDIPALMQAVWRKYYRASLQGHSLGATMQGLASISTALWDLKAKQENKPLRLLFSEKAPDKVKIYGSGINPPFLVNSIEDGLVMGMDTFKLKLGFGAEEDKNNIRELKTLLAGRARIAVDVNRSWSFAETLGWMDWLADNDIAWLEEPLSPEDQHRYPELMKQASITVSAGENFLIPPGSDFQREREWGLDFNNCELSVDVLQPAVVKNCCFSDAVRFAGLANKRGKKIFPHFLGSAPGMAASAHLASLTDDPHLEWDINPNPLRTSLFKEPFRGSGGYLALSANPGIGWDIDSDALDEWTVSRIEMNAD